MGAVLQHEQVDPRLLAIEQAAYRDVHGLAGRVHRTMEVAAAAKLREAEKALAAQRQRLELVRSRVAEIESARPNPWSRPCWICGAPRMCRHREPELVSVWREA